MNRLEFLGLANILARQFPANLFQFHLKELNLRRKRRLCLSLSASKTRRSALNLLRLRIFVSSWMGQLPRTCRFGNCLILLHCKLHLLMSCRLPNSGLEEVLCKKCNPVVAAGKDGTMDPDKTCNYCKDMGHSIDNCLCLQKHQAFLEWQGRSREGLN